MVAQSGDLRLAYRDMSVQGFNRPALAPNVYHRVAIRTYHYQLRKKHVAPLVGSLTEWRLMVNVGKSCSNFSVALDEVEPTIWHFTRQPPMILLENFCDFLFPQPRLSLFYGF